MKFVFCCLLVIHFGAQGQVLSQGAIDSINTRNKHGAILLENLPLQPIVRSVDTLFSCESEWLTGNSIVRIDVGDPRFDLLAIGSPRKLPCYKAKFGSGEFMFMSLEKTWFLH